MRLTTAPAFWRPPGLGSDGFDWIELKSGEWLKGQLKYVQHRRLEFDSDKLGLQEFDLKDVRAVYPANPMYVRFEGREKQYAPVVIQGDWVTVKTQPGLRLPRDELIGITHGGKRERDYWAGEVTLGVNLESGSTEKTEFDALVTVDRRTPRQRVGLSYLGEYSRINGQDSDNNHRANGSWDINLGSGLFARPIFAEYYRNPIENIEHRATGGVGLGYYIFDRDDLEWLVAAGPGYQQTWFKDVPPGMDSTTGGVIAAFQTSFKWEITDKLDFLLSYNATAGDSNVGTFAHHGVATLKFELTHSFDLNVSFIWDHLQNPQEESDGSTPKQDTYRTMIGVGYRF